MPHLLSDSAIVVPPTWNWGSSVLSDFKVLAFPMRFVSLQFLSFVSETLIALESPLKYIHLERNHTFSLSQGAMGKRDTSW